MFSPALPPFHSPHTPKLRQPSVKAQTFIRFRGDSQESDTQAKLIRELSGKRDELVKHFPKGFLGRFRKDLAQFTYSNGSGIGFLSFPDDKRLGIVISHEKDKDKQKVIQHLLKKQLITPNTDGTYNYQGALVQFRAVGVIRAL